MLLDLQLADLKLVDSQPFDPAAPNRQPTDRQCSYREGTNRQRADCQCANRAGAERSTGNLRGRWL